MPTAIVMSAAHRPDRQPRHAPAEQHDQEVARADVDVLEHPVALAVVEHRPGQPGDAGQHDRPQRGPDDDEGAVRRVGAAADDVEHHDEDQRGRQRLGDRVDEEQHRVGPVGLHLPAEAGRGPERPPVVARRPGLGRGAGRSRPTRASRGRRGGRASTVGARHGASLPAHRQAAFLAGHPLERPEHPAGARRGRRRSSRPGSAPRPRAAACRSGTSDPTKASWRIASRPTASGIVARASAPMKPEAARPGSSARDTK